MELGPQWSSNAEWVKIFLKMEGFFFNLQVKDFPELEDLALRKAICLELGVAHSNSIRNCSILDAYNAVKTDVVPSNQSSSQGQNRLLHANENIPVYGSYIIVQTAQGDGRIFVLSKHDMMASVDESCLKTIQLGQGQDQQLITNDNAIQSSV